METQTQELTLAEEPTMTPDDIYTSNGSLLLTAKNISLAEEIKILIRKLWD